MLEPLTDLSKRPWGTRSARALPPPPRSSRGGLFLRTRHHWGLGVGGPTYSPQKVGPNFLPDL